MANGEQMKALLKSHAAGDDERFYAVALQVAAQEARQGHDKLARELRDLVDEARQQSLGTGAFSKAGRPVPVVQPRGDLAGLLDARFSRARIRDMVLAETTQRPLERAILEQRQRSALEAWGLEPARKLLLIGPPGTGKTLTAAVLAGELDLPLFSVRSDALITRFLGETAARLRLIFDAMVQTRGVYFFDEFDALGGDRGGGDDVGEMRRVLNALLQFIEQDTSASLILAATNHVELLDRALFRRFDAVIAYTLPDPAIEEALLRRCLSVFATEALDWPQVLAAGAGLSHADLERAALQAAKTAVLAGDNTIQTTTLCATLAERRRTVPFESENPCRRVTNPT